MHYRKSLQWLFLLGTVFATGYLLADDHRHEESSRALQQVSHPRWQAECSSCHMLYHPGLLPSRSWHKLMGGLDRHFGENASLDPASRDEILRFLAANSADRQQSRRSARIAASIPSDAVPLRITETGYWKHKHDEIGRGVWVRPKIGSRSNCVACHAGAEKGDFSENKVSVPR